MILVLLVAMCFCHIVDDYYLQGFLAQAKQKEWWEENYPDKLYKHDYIVALIEHAFSWTCMIHIPVMFHMMFFNSPKYMWLYIVVFLADWAVHAIVDHCKTNLHKINLVQDQLIHLVQIVATWVVYIL